MRRARTNVIRTVRCPCGFTTVRGHRISLWSVVGQRCDCGRVLQWNSEAELNRGRAALVFAFLALIGCGGPAFGTVGVVDDAEAGLEAGAPEAGPPAPSPDAGQEAAEAGLPEAAVGIDSPVENALDASADVDAGPFCFICIPGGASGGAGYQLCGDECVTCAGKQVCRPSRDK